MKNLLEKLINKHDLSEHESSTLLEHFMSSEVSESFIASALIALRMKGETEEEILGFIKTMRKHVNRVDAEGIVVDTCGTGGDGKNTFNISTAVSFVVAGAGAHVAKHGNRSASSKCGSADVLEALGVHITITPHQATQILAKVGMVFLFAPLFHPSMKTVGKVRKELGVRTVFNFLGPFTNPAHAEYQVIGVPTIEIAEKLSRVATYLNYQHLLIITSEDGMDEISLVEKTTAFEIKGENIKRFTIDPTEFGFDYNKANIAGGIAKENAEIILNVLKGKKGAARDVVLLNSAYALFVAGASDSVGQGLALAIESIDSGNAKAILENLKKETGKYK